MRVTPPCDLPPAWLRILLLPLWLCAAPCAQGPGDIVSVPARQSSEHALRWLLAAQNTDGSWGDNAGSRGEIGNTSIALLALIAHGSTPTRGPHYRAVRRGLDWVRRRTRGYGNDAVVLDRQTLLQAKLGPNADLYLVTLLYSQVIGHNVDRLEDELMQFELAAMADRIAAAQKPNGEWETSYEPMLTTICAWLALRQAAAAGVAIRQASPQKVVDYLRNHCLEKSTGVFREQKWNRQERFVTQSGGVRVLTGSGLGQTQDCQRAIAVILKMKFDQDVGGATGGEEFLGALFATQGLFLEHQPGATDDVFPVWYDRIVKALIACQNKDGSWQGHHCITGRVFCTACSILTMLVPDKLLPMIER